MPIPTTPYAAVGSEFLVNTTTAGSQATAQITALVDGGFVVTWVTTEIPSYTSSIKAQVFNADGSANGSEFLVAAGKSYPAVTSLDTGGFVIAWPGSAQVYYADGSANGAQIALTNDVEEVGITDTTNGAFVISWTDFSGGGEIYARAYSANGEPNGNAFHVNTITNSYQYQSKITRLSNGGFVITWMDSSDYSNTETNIKAQAYNADGSPNGVEFLVNTQTDGLQFEPAITGLTGGGFVITWTDTSDYADTQFNVKAQVYNADGTPNGGEFLVNTNTSGDQSVAKATGLADGGFVITWQDDNSSTNTGSDIKAQAYTANGTPNGDEFLVNTNTSGWQSQPAIARLANGDFVIVWTDPSGALGDTDYNAISAQIFDGPAASLINAAPVITSNGGGATGAVSVAENGTAVTTVTATDADTGATLSYFLSGGADKDLFQIDVTTGALSFKVAPNFEAPADAGGDNVYDVEVLVSDGLLDDTQALAVTVTSANAAPVITSNGGGATGAVSIAENGTAVTTVTATDADAGATLSYSLSGGADKDLFQIDVTTGALSFKTAPNFEVKADAGSNNVYDVVVQVSDGSLTDTQALAVTVTNVNEAPAITSNGGGATGAVSVAENGTAVTSVLAIDADASTTLTYSISGGADATLFQIDATTGALSFISAPSFAVPADAGGNYVYDVTVRASDGTLTDTQDIAVRVTPATLGNEFRVNTTTSDLQESPTITGLANGGFVVAWLDPSGTLDSQSGGIAAQVFAADGTPVGQEFLVNTVTAGSQIMPKVTALANGGFVVAWADNSGTLGDSANFGIAAQVFQADGTKVGQEFLVNSVTASTQFQPAVTALANGGFVVSWTDFSGALDSSGHGITAQVFAADGTKVGQEFLVNTTTASNQNQSTVSGLANGGFVVSWRDVGEADGSGSGILAQVFAADGTPVGQEFVVNTTTAGAQATPAITGLGNGGFVVAWQDNDGASIRAQVFNANGSTVGAEFQVITAASGTSESYRDPKVAGLADGGFMVTWDHWSGAGYDAIQAQAFAADGAAVGSAFLVNSQAGFQYLPAVAGLANGGFAVTWVDYGVDYLVNTNSEIMAQIFQGAAAPAVNHAPVITSNGGGATGAVSVAENGTAVTTVTATDADAGATLSYSLSGGTDKDLFQIDATTGALSFKTAPNFEVKADAGSNNVYDVVVQVSDGSLTDTQALAVTVTNVNEAPAITSNGGGATGAVSVAENGTAVTSVLAIDADASTTLTYSISGGADAALLQIDAASGVLSFKTAPNFEAPADVGEDNVYNVIVTASDGTLSDTQALAITVTDVGDAPTYNTITGTALLDKLTGTSGADEILGLAGNDTLRGLAGSDLLDGGSGNDLMLGGLGDDIYVVDAKGDRVSEKTSEGTDTVQTTLAKYTLGKTVENLTFTDSAAHSGTGNALANHLTGGAGADALDGLTGADILEGGLGGDTYYVDNASDSVIEAVGGGADRVFAAVSFALAAGSEVEAVTLKTAKAALALTGSNTANVLTGNSNANTLSGLGGNDTLIGGTGNDTLTGGTGADTFVFNAKLNTKSNIDTVTDFVSGTDKLALDQTVFKVFASTGAISAGAFWSGAGVSAAHDADDRLIYNTTTGALLYDADGIGTGKAVQIAVLAGHPDLAFGDILIVA